MKTLNKLTFLAITIAIFFFFDACNKDLITSTTNPTRHGRDFAGLDSSVNDSVMVITPFGPRLKSDVHLIPNGHRLVYSGTHLQEIETSTNKLVNDFGAQAPLKYLVSNTQSNSKLHINNVNKSLNIIDNAPKSPNKIIDAGLISNEDWITWAGSSTTSKGPISTVGNTTISTSWTVPSLPAATNLNDGQILFIYEALCDASLDNIVQPVLQFGISAAGGYATSWSIFNCYISCSNCAEFPSTPIGVDPGTS
jgi:hypothetical protein